MSKKPAVDKSRKTKLRQIVGNVTFDGMTSVELKELAERLDELTSESGCEFVGEPKIKYVYYGYDGGYGIEYSGVAYTETEQQWKDRVASEEAALKEWKAKRAERLRKELAELEGNEIGH